MKSTVAIIGLGNIGLKYDLQLDANQYVYSHARAFSQHPSYQLVAGIDSDAHSRHVFEQEYQCPSYEDVNDAILNHTPEIVIIALPTNLHGDILQQILAHDHVKVVLCEKPLSYDLEEARFMVDACEARGIRLYVNYMRRSDPGVIEIRRRIDAGEVSLPIKGVVWYSKGFLHNGSHFFNLLHYWLGSMKNSVVLNRGRLWNESDSEPDVQVTFERGQVVFLAAWEEAFSHYTVELLSPSGRLRYEQGGKRIQWQSARPDSHHQGYTVLSAMNEEIDSGMDRYQWHVAEELAKALNGQHAQLCSGADAFYSLECMKQILE